MIKKYFFKILVVFFSSLQIAQASSSDINGLSSEIKISTESSLARKGEFLGTTELIRAEHSPREIANRALDIIAPEIEKNWENHGAIRLTPGGDYDALELTYKRVSRNTFLLSIGIYGKTTPSGVESFQIIAANIKDTLKDKVSLHEAKGYPVIHIVPDKTLNMDRGFMSIDIALETEKVPFTPDKKGITELEAKSIAKDIAFIFGKVVEGMRARKLSPSVTRIEAEIARASAAISRKK